jgi:PAS domain S-box-containing protein
LSNQRKKIILLVDDEEPVAMAQAQALRRLGYGCLVAFSGEAAVQLVASNPEIALILMDADLGRGINSREVGRRILAVRDLPIVFLASHPERRMPGTSGLSSFRYMLKNSDDMELQASVEAAFELFASQQEAKKSEEWQRLILATVPIAIYVSPIDPATDASWVSGDIEKVTGFTAGQYLAEKDFWRNRLHPDDRQRVLNSYKDPAAGEEIVIEYRWLCKDGNYKWFYDWAKKKYTQRGIEYFGIILDISERKRAEERLHASEIRYRRLFETAQDGILILDAETGTITDVNPFLSEMLGYTAEEIRGRKIWELGSFRDIIANQTNFLELQQKGYIRYEDLPLESADGRRHHVEFISNVYQVNQRSVIQCNIRDIGERKQAENIIRVRLRLVEYAADHSLAELLQKTLDEVCALTDSPIGFYHFVDPDQFTLTLQGWSTRTLQEFCTATPKGAHYNIDEAGVWVDCIRQRRPVIHNDYAALPHRKGLPEGHAQVRRELVVPILREQKIVAVLGIGNKEQDYTEKDIEFVAYFADVAWEITRRKRVEEALEQERNRLQKALDEVKTLRGIIPICSSCKQIRDDKGYWRQVERYISDHIDAEFTHGICPECMKKLYPFCAET